MPRSRGRRVVWVDVEAGIACGKSTLLARIIALLQWRVVICKEPVKKWIDGGHLAAFYKSMEECGGADGTAVAFQMLTFATRAQEYTEAMEIINTIYDDSGGDDDEVVILLSERSLYADRAVFAEMLRRDGVIAPHLYNIYVETWKSWNAMAGGHRPDVVLWLNTPVEESYRRYEERDRAGEKFPLKYAEALHARHVELLANRKRAGDELGGGEVLEIDGRPNFRDSDVEAQRIADRIAERVRAVIASKY